MNWKFKRIIEFFQVVLRFTQPPDEDDLNLQDKNIDCYDNCITNNSESESISSEDEDEPSDQEYNNIDLINNCSLLVNNRSADNNEMISNKNENETNADKCDLILSSYRIGC